MIKNDQKGFTLIEAVAVIGVLAVTSAILIVNNRLNELQLSLSKDVSVITNSVSRAKALTLQGSGAGCYGVHLEPSHNSTDPDKYIIFEDIDCNKTYESTVDKILSDQGANNLSSGLRFVTVTSGTSYFIKDLFFYSSDARVKLTGIDNNDIKPAGVIIIATESMPTSFMTLKITTTGQVTSRTGAYITPDNFDKGTGSNLMNMGDGTFTFTIGEGTIENGDIGDNEDSLIVNPPEDICIPISCAGKTCEDYNGCGSPCVSCGLGQVCINKACTSCTPNCTGKVCGEDNGCGASCTYCLNGECDLVTKQCVIGGPVIIVVSIDPPIGLK